VTVEEVDTAIRIFGEAAAETVHPRTGTAETGG
jgi:hypothetical protein